MSTPLTSAGDNLSAKEAFKYLEQKYYRKGIDDATLDAEWDALDPVLHEKQGEAAKMYIRKEERLEIARNATLDNPFDYGWHGGWPIRYGYQGVSCLWIAPDKFGNIIGRQVVKDCYLDTVWNEPTTWHGPRELNDTAEYFAHKTIQHITVRGQRMITLVGTSNRGNQSRDKMLRLHHGYYPHRDLAEQVNYYNYVNGGPPYKGVVQTKTIPEPFIWYVAEVLASSCKIMSEGATPASIRDKWWEPMVHRDIKLSHIYLGLPDPIYFPSYPRPVLGEWGRVAFLPAVDRLARPGEGPRPPFAGLPIRNPEDLLKGGDNPQWWAPEQDPRWDRGDLPAWPVGPWTNIWQMGACIARLAGMDQGEGRQPWNGDAPDTKDFHETDGYGREDWEEWEDGKYSDRLRDLVNRCLNFNPGGRPNADQCLKWIRGTFEGELKDFYTALRFNTTVSGGNLGLDLPQEEYRIGMSIGSLQKKENVKVREFIGGDIE